MTGLWYTLTILLLADWDNMSIGYLYYYSLFFKIYIFRYDSDLSYDVRAAAAREQIILTSIGK